MDDLTAQVVAKGLQAGDVESWREMYDAFAPAVWRMVTRWLGPSSGEVADVVQETFLAAARSARNFDSAKGTLWWWLCGIARHQMALHCRRTTRRREIVGELPDIELDDPPTAWNTNPLEVAALSEQASVVREVLLDLPDEYALLLSAKYFDEISVEQLAADTRSSEVAVRSKLARARQAFRGVFERRMGVSRTSLLTD
ncbi:MAG: sigma-70 family RNA polymerase sigma factor [Planctomycetia bacterium]|nr:sigma-70 family RNA polymerase sigma factor [Planctomycetia bacterium]